jgi:hypothetical protein
MFNAKTEILPRWDIISGVFCDCNGHIFENWVIDVFDTTEESDWFWRKMRARDDSDEVRRPHPQKKPGQLNPRE